MTTTHQVFVCQYGKVHSQCRCPAPDKTRVLVECDREKSHRPKETPLEMQHRLQLDAYGINYKTMTDEEKIQAIKDMTLALTDELHEALAEVGWKPWATSRHINYEAFKGELIDAYHFLMNLFLIAGMNDSEVTARYVEKNRRNLKRQEEGYDGVAGKCPRCHRALDDSKASATYHPYCSADCHE